MTDVHPILMKSYREYNFIQFGSLYYAVPRFIGEIDLSNPQHMSNPLILSTAQREELERLVDKRGAWDTRNPLYSPTPLTEFSIPEVVEIEPIHTCNLRCVMCHVSYENLTKQSLDPAFIKRMDGLEGKWAKLGSLYEPVAHPQFAEIAQGLSERGMKLDLISNGSLFTPALIERIQDYNFQIVTISFDGTRKETYERIRRRGNFDMTLRRILAFKEALLAHGKNPFFQVNYTVLASNMNEVPEAVELWDGYGFDHIGFIGMVTRDDTELLKAESIHPHMAHLQSVLDQAALRVIEGKLRITLSSPHFRDSRLREKFPENFRSTGEGVVTSAHPKARLPFTPSSHFQNGSFPGMQVACRSPFKFARIWYDGSVSLCQQFPVGNIYKQDLLEIWYAEQSRQLREAVRKDGTICYDCEYFKLCIKANDINYMEEKEFESHNRMILLESEITSRYTILFWLDRYYATPPGAPVTPQQILIEEERKRRGILIADNYDGIQRAIHASNPEYSPILFCTYRKYNLMQVGPSYYAVPNWIGAIDTNNLKNSNVPEILSATKREQLERLVDEKGAWPAAVLVDHPIMIREYREYNLFQFGFRFYALPQILGAVDFNNAEQLQNPLILSATGEAELEKLVDTKGAWHTWNPLYSPTPLTEFSVPEVVEIEPIHTCNLRCVMCHVSYERLTKESLDPAFVTHMNGLEGKWAKLGSLYEPVAHPQFAEIAQGLTERGMKLDLISNGSLFTPALIERIQDCNFQIVTISFDGVRKDTYERIRRRGNFDLTLRRVLAFKEALLARGKKPFFQINYTILASNMDEVPEAVEFWESHGFDHIGFIGMVTREDTELLKTEAILPHMEHLQDVLDQAAARVIEGKLHITLSSPLFRSSRLRERYPEHFPLSGDGLVTSGHNQARLPFTPSSHFQNGAFPGMEVACRSPYKFARIWYDGTVSLCQQFPVGNINDEDLLEIWYAEQSRQLREAVRKDSAICYSCEYFKLCINANDVKYDEELNFESRNRITELEIIAGYNVLSWLGRFYAVPLGPSVTPKELVIEYERRKRGILACETYEEILQAIRNPSTAERLRRLQRTAARTIQRITTPKHQSSMHERSAESWDQNDDLRLSLRYWLLYPDVAVTDEFGPMRHMNDEVQNQFHSKLRQVFGNEEIKGRLGVTLTAKEREALFREKLIFRPEVPSQWKQRPIELLLLLIHLLENPALAARLRAAEHAKHLRFGAQVHYEMYGNKEGRHWNRKQRVLG